jgi:hypothetical protein
MNLTELLQEVYGITNRPDLYSKTVSAIQSATLALHQSEFFPRDIHETGVQFDAPRFVQSWEYNTIYPRFRAVKYIRKSDAAGYGQGKFLSVITPDQVVDSYGINNTDVCYLAGSCIEIKSSTELQYILTGVYVNPDITISGYSSWIAETSPFTIVHSAAARVLTGIGKREEAADQASLGREAKQALLTANILAGGW